MGHIIADLKETFKRGNIYIQLIYINVAVFMAGMLTQIGLQLFNVRTAPFSNWFALPASFTDFLCQPWSILTYMFIHAGVFHILFNMLWLYWFGSLFLYFFSAKHLRGLYVLGGICGGLLYMVAYNVFPFFSNQIADSILVGASASVLAIVAATAYREPNYPVQLFFFGSLRLKYLALTVIGMDVLSITSINAGGHIAHLGGALAGLWFASSLSKGTDLTTWINKALDGCMSLLQREKRTRKPKMKIHYGHQSTSKRAQDYDYNARKKAQLEEVDRILEKLKKSGYDSLTSEEKKSLFDASKR
ncbi:transmembrane rhomboid family protein [gut metagenome]|uniref:Transmembrane rhomboid family protein n=1 Tax=gut metagenome TaxID=749906 RepID=J9GMI0_9ZZZZ